MSNGSCKGLESCLRSNSYQEMKTISKSCNQCKIYTNLKKLSRLLKCWVTLVLKHSTTELRNNFPHFVHLEQLSCLYQFSGELTFFLRGLTGGLHTTQAIFSVVVKTRCLGFFSKIISSEAVAKEVLFLRKSKAELVLTNLKLLTPLSFIIIKDKML